MITKFDSTYDRALRPEWREALIARNETIQAWNNIKDCIQYIRFQPFHFYPEKLDQKITEQSTACLPIGRLRYVWKNYVKKNILKYFLTK